MDKTTKKQPTEVVSENIKHEPQSEYVVNYTEMVMGTAYNMLIIVDASNGKNALEKAKKTLRNNPDYPYREITDIHRL